MLPVKMTYKVVVLSGSSCALQRESGFAFVVDILILASGIWVKASYFKPFEMHAGRMSLNHSGVAIYVNHQSGRKSPLHEQGENNYCQAG